MVNQEVIKNIAEMQKSINCLALELHESIYDDVNARWTKLRDSLSTIKECSDISCQIRKEN
jgi:hypothetical protein